MGVGTARPVTRSPLQLEIIRFRGVPTAEQFNDLKVRASRNNLAVVVVIGDQTVTQKGINRMGITQRGVYVYLYQ